DAQGAFVRSDSRVEDRRQLPQLLARQHHDAGAVAADQPGNEIQGQTGGRLLLCAGRRRPLGWRGVCGRAHRADREQLCGPQRRVRVRMARGGVWIEKPVARGGAGDGQGRTVSAMTPNTSDVFSDPHPFPPWSSRVRVEFGAESRKGKPRELNDDHYLIVQVGRYQETMMTSLPEGSIPQ